MSHGASCYQCPSSPDAAILHADSGTRPRKKSIKIYFGEGKTKAQYVKQEHSKAPGLEVSRGSLKLAIKQSSYNKTLLFTLSSGSH